MGIEEEKLRDTLRRWQEALGLRGWRIRAQAAPEGWKRSADLKVDAKKQLALVLVNETVTPESLDEVILHELVRLQLHAVDRMLVGLMTSVYGSDKQDPSWILARRQCQDQLDAAIQCITDALLGLDGREGASGSTARDPATGEEQRGE